jgi:ubiquinone/menaquinone biosynthesis C-methylase UbiE
MKDNKILNFYKNNAKVLDIGFGSGRDLRTIQTISPNIFGLDACEQFVNHSNKTTLKGKVAP